MKVVSAQKKKMFQQETILSKEKQN